MHTFPKKGLLNPLPYNGLQHEDFGLAFQAQSNRNLNRERSRCSKA
jgi:hypothetical protein